VQRQQLQLLKEWLSKKNRKPLIIRGARQVGKSTLVELFAEDQQQVLLNINLERYPELASVFATKDPQQVLQQIEFLPKAPKINNNSLFSQVLKLKNRIYLLGIKTLVGS